MVAAIVVAIIAAMIVTMVDGDDHGDGDSRAK